MKTPWQNVTPSKMTAVWWQWAMSVPFSSSPFYDEDGTSAFIGQPYFTAPGGARSLLFLAGTFIVTEKQNGDTVGEVTRSITFKQGTTLFFPLLNGEADSVFYRPNLGASAHPENHITGKPALLKLLANSSPLDEASGCSATVTPTDAQFNATGPAKDLDIMRLASPPFRYTLPAEDNLYQAWGVDISGNIAPAVADGWWSSVPGDSLVPGHYILQFGGSMPGNTGVFTEVITYLLTVTP